MDVMLQLFQEFVSPEQKKLAAMVEERGGKAAVCNDVESMRELSNEEPTSAARSGSASDNRNGTSRSFNFIELKREIESDPDEAIEKNLKLFDSVCKLQTRQIEEITVRVVTQQGDRIIDAVKAGPHDRIVDQV